MKKENLPNFRKDRIKDNSSKKIVLVMSVILFLVLFVLIYSFFHQYDLRRKHIEDIFNERRPSSHTEFDTNSFEDLIFACNNKTIGEACEVNFNGENSQGTCMLTQDNRTVCMKNIPYEN